jgi:glycosyltransferase involved in cell wall biosynthesis
MERSARRSDDASSLRVAVQGILAENAGSGAGAFPILLSGLLERGHRIEFFGNPGYVRPRSLERFPGYRFRPLHVAAVERIWQLASGFSVTRAAAAQVAHVGYASAAMRLIGELHREDPYDFVLCTDQQALWPSSLPVVSWPQSPPQTEGAALREPVNAKAYVQSRGVGRYAAVQAYYAYRALLARGVLGFSDLYLCATRWARDEWVRFGLEPGKVRLVPYPVSIEGSSVRTPVGRRAGLTLLWLGRAVPRKRLDLFLGAYEQVRRRHPGVSARLVGNLRDDPFATRILSAYEGLPGLSVEEPVPRGRVPDLLAEVDVLVQPSQNENFGFSVAEALAAGRLVVAGPTNGTLEYAGQAGFGFSEYNPESVALAIERSLEAARSRGAELSRIAQQSALAFSTDSVVEHFCRIGSELVARTRRSADAKA